MTNKYGTKVEQGYESPMKTPNAVKRVFLEIADRLQADGRSPIFRGTPKRSSFYLDMTYKERKESWESELI